MQKPFGPHTENICNKIRSTQMQITSDLFSLHQFGWAGIHKAMTWESNWKFMDVANHRTPFIHVCEHSYNCLRCFWLVSNCFQMSCKGSLCNLLSTQCTKCVHRNSQSWIVVNSKHIITAVSLLSSQRGSGYVRLRVKRLSQVFKLCILKESYIKSDPSHIFFEEYQHILPSNGTFRVPQAQSVKLLNQSLDSK